MNFMNAHPAGLKLLELGRTLAADFSGVSFSRIARYLPLHVVLILTVGVLITMFVGLKPNYLFKEGRIFTHFSGLLLLLIGAASLHVFRLRWRQNPCEWKQLGRQVFFVWFIMGAGFVFLWADEVACYHEKLGDWLQSLNAGYTGIVAERFDSLVVGFYGLGSLVVLILYRGELLAFLKHSLFFVLGFGLLFLMVGLDFLTEDMKLFHMMTTDKALAERLFIVFEVMEDYFKLLSIAFFLRGFLEIRWQILCANKQHSPLNA